MNIIRETDKDRTAQREIATLAALHWGFTTREHPTLYPVDFTFLDDGEPVELVEIKDRSNKFGKYRHYMISLDKWRSIWRLMREQNLPGVLLVRFTDCIAWTMVTAEPWLVRNGGRRDRKVGGKPDPHDTGPMAYTPMTRFVKLT